MRDFAPFLGLPLWVWLFVLPTFIVVLAGIFPDAARPVLRPIWAVLDRIYKLCGAIAACFLVMILLLIVAQMITRWTSTTFSGSTAYAGYSMAASSFFALAYTLTRGGHIRVSIVLELNDRTRFWLDALATWIAALIATYFARFAIKANGFSAMLNDRTQGQDTVPDWLLSVFKMFGTAPSDWGQLWSATSGDWVFTPLWLPQLPMSFGAALLALALWDMLSRLLVTRQTAIIGEALE